MSSRSFASESEPAPTAAATVRIAASPSMRRLLLAQRSKRREKHLSNMLLDVPRRGCDRIIEQRAHEGEKRPIAPSLHDLDLVDVALIAFEFDRHALDQSPGKRRFARDELEAERLPGEHAPRGVSTDR